jgi:hypothetical protein
MTRLYLDLFTIGLLILLTISIYLMIVIVFLNARHKYKGGLVEQVINFIIGTLGFLMVADVSLFLMPLYGYDIGYSIHVIFKIIAMACLAVGGLKFIER